MSRFALAVLLAAVIGSPLRAQDAAAWRDTASRLQGEYERLRDSLLQRDTGLVEVGRVGDLVMHATPSLAEEARIALQVFAERREDWLGAAGASAAGFRIMIRFSDYARWGFGRRGGRTVILRGLPDTGEVRDVGTGFLDELQDGRQLARGLLQSFADQLAGGTHPAVRQWLKAQLPFGVEPAERRHEAMWAMVTGGGPAHRRCVRGDLRECGYLLWLTESAVAEPGPQFPISIRGDFLLAVLEWSDNEAWARLNAPGESSLQARLAAAGGAPLDSLIARWRRETLALRPESSSLRAPVAIAALAWTGFLLLCALGLARWV